MECEISGLIRAVVPMTICESSRNLNFVLFSSKIGDQTFTLLVFRVHTTSENIKFYIRIIPLLPFLHTNLKKPLIEYRKGLEIGKQRPQKHNSRTFLRLLQEPSICGLLVTLKKKIQR